jgi:hypothetical protein
VVDGLFHSWDATGDGAIGYKELKQILNEKPSPTAAAAGNGTGGNDTRGNDTRGNDTRGNDTRGQQQPAAYNDRAREGQTAGDEDEDAGNGLRHPPLAPLAAPPPSLSPPLRGKGSKAGFSLQRNLQQKMQQGYGGCLEGVTATTAQSLLEPPDPPSTMPSLLLGGRGSPRSASSAMMHPASVPSRLAMGARHTGSSSPSPWQVLGTFGPPIRAPFLHEVPAPPTLPPSPRMLLSRHAPSSLTGPSLDAFAGGGGDAYACDVTDAAASSPGHAGGHAGGMMTARPLHGRGAPAPPPQPSAVAYTAVPGPRPPPTAYGGGADLYQPSPAYTALVSPRAPSQGGRLVDSLLPSPRRPPPPPGVILASPPPHAPSSAAAAADASASASASGIFPQPTASYLATMAPPTAPASYAKTLAPLRSPLGVEPSAASDELVELAGLWHDRDDHLRRFVASYSQPSGGAFGGGGGAHGGGGAFGGGAAAASAALHSTMTTAERAAVRADPLGLWSDPSCCGAGWPQGLPQGLPRHPPSPRSHSHSPRNSPRSRQASPRFLPSVAGCSSSQSSTTASPPPRTAGGLGAHQSLHQSPSGRAVGGASGGAKPVTPRSQRPNTRKSRPLSPPSDRASSPRQHGGGSGGASPPARFVCACDPSATAFASAAAASNKLGGDAGAMGGSTSSSTRAFKAGGTAAGGGGGVHVVGADGQHYSAHRGIARHPVYDAS